jgi:acyl-CoA thioesterase FadM
VQHAGYLRVLEEVVDRFLSARGISVGRLLVERSWIPVVSKVRIQLVSDARMGEAVHTTFVVEEILKGIAYEARMDCYVQRGETLFRTARAWILHGYVVSDGRGAGALAELDDSIIEALNGAMQ